MKILTINELKIGKIYKLISNSNILHNKQYHFILRITDISYSFNEIFGEKINNDRTFDSWYGVVYSWYDIYPIDIKL